jgi:hypothetical protein
MHQLPSLTLAPLAIFCRQYIWWYGKRCDLVLVLLKKSELAKLRQHKVSSFGSSNSPFFHHTSRVVRKYDTTVQMHWLAVVVMEIPVSRTSIYGVASPCQRAVCYIASRFLFSRRRHLYSSIEKFAIEPSVLVDSLQLSYFGRSWLLF